MNRNICVLLLLLWISGCFGATAYRGAQESDVRAYMYALVSNQQPCPKPVHLISEQNGHKESMIAYTECSEGAIRVIAITPLGMTHARLLLQEDRVQTSELGNPFNGFSASDLMYLLFLAEKPSQAVLDTNVEFLAESCEFQMTRTGQHLGVVLTSTDPYCQKH